MNKLRRKQIAQAIDLIAQAKAILEQVMDDEQVDGTRPTPKKSPSTARKNGCFASKKEESKNENLRNQR